MINPADSQAQESNDLMRAEFKRQVEDATAKLKRVERESAEHVERLQATI